MGQYDESGCLQHQSGDLDAARHRSDSWHRIFLPVLRDERQRSILGGFPQSFTTAGGVWEADASTAWSDTSEWQGGTIADGVDNMADFSTIGLTAERIVTLDTSRTVGALKFSDVNNSYDWTIAGANSLALSTLNTNRSPSIEVDNRSATIEVPVMGSEGLTKSGAGTLLLAGQNSYSGLTMANAGSFLG